jgi:chromosome segregation protein
MKIKDIGLYGFKSFAGETKCVLTPGITAFVGPNGSGKSNIFDALRWVFGEQSMKALRCEKNEDLIHTSPELIDETNFTEVSVIIENEDFFPQFGSEFEIKRRFYRTGESEFYLNRVKCRLQDIQALFLNSGTLTYSFLELAEIEKIIHGDTKDMFDDVSGILRYQERREQTNRRLEQTEQDLLRLEDVIGEMERGIRSLRRQARQAQMYQELREEYKTVNLAIMKTDYLGIIKSISDARERKARRDNERQSALQALSHLEEERKRWKEELAAAEQQKKENAARINDIKQAIAELETTIAHSDEKAKELLIASERLVASAREKQELVALHRKRMIEYEESLTRLQTELSGNEERIRNAGDALTRAQTEYFTSQQVLKKQHEEIGDLKSIIDLDRDEIVKLESSRLNKTAIVDRINGELSEISQEVVQYQSKKEQKDNELQETIRERDKITARLTKAQGLLKAGEAESRALEDEIDQRQAELSDLKVAIDTLTHRIGQPDGIKQVRQQFGAKITGLLREITEVTAGYETAVDICLADILGYFVLSDFDLEDLGNLPEGRIGFIALRAPDQGSALPAELSGLKSLADVVRVKADRPAVSAHLRRFLIADDAGRALSLSEKYDQYGFVMREGILFDRGTIAVLKGDVGYFRITQTLQESRRRQETLNNEMIFIQDRKKHAIANLDGIRQDIEQLSGTLLSLSMKRSEASLHLNELSQQVQRLTREQDHLTAERDVLARDIELIQKHTADFDVKKNKAAAEITSLTRAAEQGTATAAQLKTRIEEQTAALNEIVLQTSVLRERHDSLVKTIAAMIQDNKTVEEEIAAISKNEVNRQLAEIQGHVSSLKSEAAVKKQALAELEFTAPDKRIEEISGKQENLYEELTVKQKTLEEIQNDVLKIDYEVFQLEYRQEELAKKAMAEFSTDLAAYQSEEIPDIKAKQAEIRERLEKLGEINPLSLQAYEQEKKRLDEFFTQRNDIIAAKQSLLKSIDELDQRARDRFITTFNEVKEKFNTVFANFFEGGEADLVLSDAANPLTSAVQIVVRMKGKRVKTINQLSGGERTLLAVSLLLAFYLVKPAPFCILDEIDAPLDDANVVRFNKFLRDLSQRTQVVIITHNRATMEYADYLYGLTMEKAGQSKIISVRLADLEKLDAVP